MSTSQEWTSPPPRPQSSFQSYQKTVESSIEAFVSENLLVELLEKKQARLEHYHRLLIGIFHQVYYSSTSFALAGAMCTRLDIRARQYLLHHAEEEQDHWQWILNDLKNTGYTGPDPRGTFPNWAAQSYLSYGIYLASFQPLGRLAMAHTLEGISGKFGLKLGAQMLGLLGLKKEQAQFFLAHGELDQGHTQDIVDLLEQLRLTPEECAEFEHITQTTSQLYKNIYNHAALTGSGTTPR